MKLTNWTARRSGKGLTIKGTDENGDVKTITGVDEIEGLAGVEITFDGTGKAKADTAPE